MLILLAIYKVGMLVAGVFLAIKSRVIVMKDFQERTQLGYAIKCAVAAVRRGSVRPGSLLRAARTAT